MICSSHPERLGKILACACFWRLPTPLIFPVSGWACHVKISCMLGRGWHESAVEMLLSRRNRSTLNSIVQVFRPYQKIHLPQSLASGCGFTTLYFCWTLKKNNWDRRWIGVTRWRCTWWWSLWRSCGTSFFHCRRGRWWSSIGSGNWDSTKNAWRMGSQDLVGYVVIQSPLISKLWSSAIWKFFLNNPILGTITMG